MYRKIAYTFMAITVVTIVAVLWLSSARATVEVNVQHTPIRLDSSVEVARYPRSGQIPGRVVQGVFEKIKEFEITDTPGTPAAPTTDAGNTSQFSLTTPTTAPTAPPVPTITVPDSELLAKGTVRIVNKYSRAQTLVKTTRLLTSDGKLYRIDANVKINPNSEATVGVYADKPGAAYAIGPSKFTIPGLFSDLQKYIYAESDEAFVAKPTVDKEPTPTAPVATPKPAPKPAAGTKIVTREQLDAAYKVLMDATLEDAKKTLVSEVSDTNFTETVYFVKVLEKKANVTAGQPASSIIASVKLDVTAVFYPKEDMLALIRSKLKEKIPEGREFLPLDQNNVVFTLDSADAKAESAIIGIKADGGYRLTSTSPQLQKEAMAGKSREDIIASLKALDGVNSVIITIQPNWLSKLPALKDHIDVIVK